MKLSPRLPDFPTPEGNDDQPVTVGWLKQWERNFYERFYEYHREIVEVTDPLEHRTGVWTPTITFATVGDLAVAYTTQQGFYLRSSRLMFADYQITTSNFTWTTSAGGLLLQGLPVPLASISGYIVSHKVEYQGITKAGYSEVAAVMAAGGTDVSFDIYGPGKATTQLVAADLPTAGTVVLRGSLIYRIS